MRFTSAGVRLCWDSLGTRLFMMDAQILSQLTRQ